MPLHNGNATCAFAVNAPTKANHCRQLSGGNNSGQSAGLDRRSKKRESLRLFHEIRVAWLPRNTKIRQKTLMIDIKQTDEEIKADIYCCSLAVELELPLEYRCYSSSLHGYLYEKNDKNGLDDRLINDLVLIIKVAYGLSVTTKIFKDFPSKKEALRRLDKTLSSIEKIIYNLEGPPEYFGDLKGFLFLEFHKEFDPTGKSVLSSFDAALKNLCKIRDCIKVASQSYVNNRTQRNKNMTLPYVAEAITILFEGGDFGAFSLHENGLACQSVVTVMACINCPTSAGNARAGLADFKKNRNNQQSGLLNASIAAITKNNQFKTNKLSKIKIQ